MENLTRVGCFHTDMNRRFVKSSSTPDVGSYLCLPQAQCTSNLMEGFENYNYHKMTYEALDHVLQFMAQPDEIHLLQNTDFVTHRGILSKIMVTAEVPLCFIASKVDDVIYLAEKPFIPIQTLKQNYMGRKFASLIFGAAPNTQPAKDQVINNAKGFQLVLKASFGGHQVLYNAKIDGVVAAEQHVPLDDLQLVQAKLRNKRIMDCDNKSWEQAYLAGVDTLVYGYQRGNILQDIYKIPEDQIRPVDLKERLEFLYYVLDFVKGQMMDSDDPNYIYEFRVSLDENFEYHKFDEIESFMLKAFVDQVKDQGKE